jgi:hypothetical protein
MNVREVREEGCDLRYFQRMKFASVHAVVNSVLYGCESCSRVHPAQDAGCVRQDTFQRVRALSTGYRQVGTGELRRNSQQGSRRASSDL